MAPGVFWSSVVISLVSTSFLDTPFTTGWLTLRSVIVFCIVEKTYRWEQTTWCIIIIIMEMDSTNYWSQAHEYNALGPLVHCRIFGTDHSTTNALKYSIETISYSKNSNNTSKIVNFWNDWFWSLKFSL